MRAVAAVAVTATRIVSRRVLKGTRQFFITRRPSVQAQHGSYHVEPAVAARADRQVLQMSEPCTVRRGEVVMPFGLGQAHDRRGGQEQRRASPERSGCLAEDVG